jgi:DNA-binding GntR family transcriptional regulator
MRSGSESESEIAKRSVAGLAYDTISERIASGEFGANERLTEAQLVKELQVSRGAVREAMSKLSADGLIEIELNKGAVVRAITRKDLSDFLQVRAIFESFAARRTAERINEPGIREAIHEVIEQCNALEANPTAEGMIENDSSFHSAIMELSGNAIMAAEWRRLRRSRYRIGFLKSLSSEEVLISVAQHREALYAILDGDPELASGFAAKHVRLTNSRIQRMSNEQFEAIFNPPGRQLLASGKSAAGSSRKAASKPRRATAKVA